MDECINPQITIVTPSFNQGRFIEMTIQSVLNQTYKDIQYIIVDGGSTDETMEVIEKYRDKIDIIIHEKDKGQTDAINKGFRLAKGELVGWINSDDILYPNCVEKIVTLYKNNPKASIYYYSINNIIDENGNLLETYQHIIPNRNHLLNINWNVIQQGSFYKTEIVRKVNYLDDTIYYCMDLDLWLKLLQYEPIVHISDGPQAAFRKHSESKTINGINKFWAANKQTVLKHGGTFLSENILKRYYWYTFKYYIKKIIQ